ncbi:SulP family inorganic anion transporter [Clostridium rectalis]|uniref:SulP family inorganic anion transporter n=1 Tax=Clostridium rectalis TaxID=2040295 RepID=UPI000F63B52B|nr:SulP family inorganic anion transporter [Clostridium rectalis]
MIEPKMLSIIKNGELNKDQILKDIIAGIIVAIIALPLSVALAIASGVSPEKGLITAIVAGFLISILGGSRVQIGGPTGAFVVIVYGIVEKYGIEGLTIASIMAGIILVIFALLKFGDLIKFIPYTITTGFTTGIAVVLFSTQIKDFLGLNIDKVPSEFIPKWTSYFQHINSINYYALIIGIVSLLIIIFWSKINKTIPGSLVALIVATLLVKFLKLPVETIGSRFGEISSTIPAPKFPVVDLKTFKELLNPAITIAVLAGIESLLSAVVSDEMVADKHDSNAELMAQGVANIGSALFGGIPATGAIARTAANVKNGGKTPIAGIVHAVVLLFTMLIFMPFAKLVPMTALGAILMVVSYNMSQLKVFKSLLKAPKGEVLVLLITFLFTVVFDLVIAIEIGMVISMFLFMKKMCESTKVNSLSCHEEIAHKVKLYEINGPFVFGAVEGCSSIISKLSEDTEVLILKMSKVPIMDATAFNAIKSIHCHCIENDISLMFSEVQEQPMKVMKNMGILNRLGEKRFFKNINEALKAARKVVKLEA